MEQARKRDRERRAERRAEEVSNDGKSATGSGGRRSTPFARAVRNGAALVEVAGGVLACWKTFKKRSVVGCLKKRGGGRFYLPCSGVI